MELGTKSLLFGVHAFWLHPWFVALAWWRLYGFERVHIGARTAAGAPNPNVTVLTSLWDWRLWLAFLVHDWGYWGCTKMDDADGETHPEFGGILMHRATFGEGVAVRWAWENFVRYHSRFFAKRERAPLSPLAYADKLSIAITPPWIYLPLANLTGEVREYMDPAANGAGGKYAGEGKDVSSQWAWKRTMSAFVRAWVDEHKDGRADTWTLRGDRPPTDVRLITEHNDGLPSWVALEDR